MLNKNEEYDLAVKAAILYYNKNLKQEDIGNILGLSKPKVSRLLQKARKSGIVTIKIKQPLTTNRQLEARLIEQYSLRDAVVATYSDADNLLTQLGKVCAFYLDIFLKDNSVLGVSIGNAVAEVIKYLKPRKRNNLHVLQLIGGFTKVASYNALSIVTNFCKELNAEGTYVNVPVLVENIDLKNRLFQKDGAMFPVSALWGKCNIAVTGVGNASSESSFVKSDIISLDDMQKIKSMGGVGDILGYFFDKKGKLLNLELSNRIIAMPFEQIRKIERVIAVAGGDHKVEAIKGALKTGCIDVLATDEDTASKVIEEE